MEKDRLDMIIGEGLKEEVRDIRMSSSLKGSIMAQTVKGRMSPYDRLKKLMNTTIEISMPPVMAACVLIGFLTFSVFRVTGDMKRDESIQGYTNVKVVNIGGAQVYIEDDSMGGIDNEED